MALENLVLTTSPHIKTKETTAVAMKDVLIALVPAVIAAIIAFTYNALFILAVCVITAELSELAMRGLMRRKATLNDYSAAVTGLLLGLCLPATIHWAQAVIGTIVAVVVAKELMGGLGRNIFNPALFGFGFLLIGSGWLLPITGRLGMISGGFDGVTTATPLAILKSDMPNIMPGYLSLFFGNYGGALAEVGAFWVLLGGGYLLYKGHITWRIPTVMIGTVFVFSAILGKDPLAFILAGGVFLGAFFMATDWVTSPSGYWAQIAYAFLIGIIVVLIRVFGGPAGAVCFAILIGNLIAPLLDRLMHRRKFGEIPA